MQRSFLAACVFALLACAGTDQERTVSEEPLRVGGTASALPAKDTSVKPAVAKEPRGEEPQAVESRAVESAPPIELPWPVFYSSWYHSDSISAVVYAIGWPGAEHGVSEPTTLPASVVLLHEGECMGPALKITPTSRPALPAEVEPRLPLYRLEGASKHILDIVTVRQSLAFPADMCPAGPEEVYIFGESSLWPTVEEEAKEAALKHLGWSAEEYSVEWHRGGGSWRLADGSHHLWVTLKVSAGPAGPWDYVVVGAYETAEDVFAIRFVQSTGPRESWVAMEPVDIDGDGELEMVFWTMAYGPPLYERYGLAILKRDAAGEYRVWRRVTVEDVEARG